MPKNRLRTAYMALSKLKAAPKNPKSHKTDAIGASIEHHGFIEPVVLDERTGRIAHGHGRVEALRKAKESGADPPANVIAKGRDWLIPVSRGWRSKTDDEALAASISLNRISELGGWNETFQAELANLVEADVFSPKVEEALTSPVEAADLPETTPPSDDDGWVSFYCRVPSDAAESVREVLESLASEVRPDVPEPVRNGLTLVKLCADWRAGKAEP